MSIAMTALHRAKAEAESHLAAVKTDTKDVIEQGQRAQRALDTATRELAEINEAIATLEQAAQARLLPADKDPIGHTR